MYGKAILALVCGLAMTLQGCGGAAAAATAASCDAAAVEACTKKVAASMPSGIPTPDAMCTNVMESMKCIPEACCAVESVHPLTKTA